MRPTSERQLDRVFHALAHPARRRLLSLVARREMTVGELAAPFDISLAAVSKHIKVLEQAGLLQRTEHGRASGCRLDAAALQAADAWLEHYRGFWDGRLDALADYLAPARGRSKSKAQKVLRPGKR